MLFLVAILQDSSRIACSRHRLQRRAALACHALEVGPVVMTVPDMDRSVEFYSHVLAFQKVSDNERSGPDFDQLYGIHDAHAR